MPIKAEAAIITQKRPSQAFNNDSINLNGKVFDREVIKNGYKGSGIITDNMYFALASSDVEGFADAAVAAFGESAEEFSSREPGSVLENYFSMCKDAVNGTAHAGSELSAVALYACGRKVVSCFDGKVKLYSINANGISAYSAENTAVSGSCCSCVFPDVSAGDIFLLVSSGVTDTLSDKDIADICKVSDGSVKRIASLITKVALSKINTQAVSVIAVKILETGLDTDGVTGFSPVFPDAVPDSESFAEDKKTAETEETAAEEAKAEEKEEVSAENTEDKSSEADFIAAVTAAIDSKYTEIIEKEAENTEAGASESEASYENASDKEDSDAVIDEDEADMLTDEDDDSQTKGPAGSRQKFIIAIAAMALLSVILFIVVFAVKLVGSKGSDDALTTGNNETTTVEDVAATEEKTTEEETTEEETTEEEETAEEEEEEEEEEDETTTATPSTEPSSEEESLSAENTTAAEAETTTAAEAETTTTAEAETTTAVAETTTVPAVTEPAENEENNAEEPAGDEGITEG